ncbi:hypothetical protein [Candidatus Colwellia aromaticivorans]|uniref:hypothetical protein n=1 Tax=Candidatus Colwellia aromaticivorans TaxID=2267621 RepID=UPI000DF38C7C|nr:hypothetical protein [Candidatus Colwellia aromaticivorans]
MNINNSKKQLCRNILSVFIAVLLLMGCGGSSDESAIKTGVFLDSAVINIGYRTETLEGITNSAGQYQYLAGETVTFFIGDLVFPTINASPIVTPFDLANTEDITNNMVVNIIRLLQSLDQNGDSSDGISITELAKSSAVPSIDFTQTVEDFSSSSDVLTLLANAGQDTTILILITIEEATEHFKNSLGLTNNLIALTTAELVGSSFEVYFDQAEGSLIYHFSSDGACSVADFDGEFDCTWEVNSSGQLIVTTEDFEDTYTVTSGNSTLGTLSIHIDDIEEGILNETGKITKVGENIFTHKAVSGGDFRINFNPSGFLAYHFSPDGTGIVQDFDGQFDCTWAINSLGALVVTTEFFVDTYVLTGGIPSSGTLNIHIVDEEEGILDETGTISLHR